MTQELVQASPGELSARAERSPATIHEVFVSLARDQSVDVARIRELMELQKWSEEREAEKRFNGDYAAALLEMPRVAKNGVIDLGAKGKIPFAKYEDVDRAIRHIEAKYGFARSFTTAPSPGDPGITITLKLRHRDGHCETSTRHMPPDQGPGRNKIQELGSSGSYGKRYLTLDIWNIITEGEDNDGNQTRYISERDANLIQDKILAIGMDAESQAKFLKFMEVKAVSDIRQCDLAKANAALDSKQRKASR